MGIISTNKIYSDTKNNKITLYNVQDQPHDGDRVLQYSGF